MSIAVTAHTDAEGAGTLHIEQLVSTDIPALSAGSLGYIAPGYTITAQGELYEAQLCFSYDPALAEGRESFEPAIYWYDEEACELIEVPGQIRDAAAYIRGYAPGIPAIILVYWFYVMPSSLGEVLNGLQYLIADREHQFTYIDKFAGFFENIIYSSVVTILVVSIVLVALLVAIFKKTKKVKVICFLAVSISTIILEVSYIRNVVLSNEVLLSCFAFPPIFAGLYCGMLTKDKLSKRLFYNMYIPGLMYMFSINISSNVGFEASVIPSVICTMASCFIVSAFMKENAVSHENILLNRLGLSAFSFSVLLSLCAGIYVMSFLAFANGRIDKLNSKIERGPYKGIYCTQSVHNTYDKVVMDMEPIKNSNSEKVLLLAGYWYYLDVEKKPSSCSCLCPYIDDALLDQLEEYYSLYPQFIPDIIYLDYSNKDLLDRVKAYGYREEETALGSYILYRELEK